MPRARPRGQFYDGCAAHYLVLLVHGARSWRQVRRFRTSAGIIGADDPMLGVRGEPARVRGHGRGRGRRALLHLVQDSRHHRCGDSCSCRAGVDSYLLGY